MYTILRRNRMSLNHIKSHFGHIISESASLISSDINRVLKEHYNNILYYASPFCCFENETFYF